MAGDSTQFLIDMAAKLTGGDSSVATLAALGDHMLKAGASAADLEKAVKMTSDAVEKQSDAVLSAVGALDAGEAKYAELETAAERAAKQVEQLGSKVDAARAKLAAAADAGNDRSAERAAAKLRELVERQTEAAAKSELAAAALKDEAKALDALRASASGAKGTQDALAKGLKNVQAAAKTAAEAEAKAAGTGNLSKLASGLNAIGGPAATAGARIAGLREGFGKLATTLGAAGPYVAAAVAIIAIGTAAAAATIAITQWGVSMADANRTSTLLAAGIAHSVAGGEALTAEITKLQDIVPQSNEELTQMASNLAATGLRGKELTSALERSAVAAAKLKWGPEFQKQLLSLDVQVRRFHANVADTFGGLKIEGLLEGFHMLVKLVDSSTASGRALKFLFEALFQPVVDSVTEAWPKVERFFLQAEILALKAYIALKPYRSEIEGLAKAFAIGVAVIGGILAYTVLAVVASIGLLVAILGVVAVGFYEMGAAIVRLVGEAFTLLNDAILGAVELGEQLIDGLVKGITGGATAVVNAITGVVDSAIGAAKKALGISSPSKVFAGIGDFAAQGFAQGVSDGSGDAQSALESLVAPPAASAGGRGGSSQSVVINISVDGRGESDDGIAAKIAEAVRDIFETDALMIGAGEAVQ